MLGSLLGWQRGEGKGAALALGLLRSGVRCACCKSVPRVCRCEARASSPPPSSTLSIRQARVQVCLDHGSRDCCAWAGGSWVSGLGSGMRGLGSRSRVWGA